MLKKLLVIALSVVALAAAGCGGGDKQAQTTIKVGATAGPHAEVVEAAAKEAAKSGLKVQVVEFSDYVTPDKALADGELDLVSYQHKPFLDNFNKTNKTDLVPIGNAILMRMGIYSDKVHDVKDVVDNPKHLKFKELEAAQLPRSLADVDAAAITMNYVMSGGLDVKKQNIFLEPKDEPLAVMIIAVRNKDKDKEAYKAFVKAYQSEAVKKFIADKYKGTIEPAF